MIKTNLSGAIKAMENGYSVYALCEHHRYRMVNGRIVIADFEKVKRQYPDWGDQPSFPTEDLNCEWVIENGEDSI